MLGGFTDIFVKRPVLATVISLAILMLGLRSLQSLNVREYPESSSSVVTIATPYPGANAEVVKGFITTPLEQAIASAAGIDFLESTSIQGVSSIQAHLELNYNPDDAVAQILTKINQVRNQLPEASEDPAVTVSTGSSSASMYIAFTSDILAANQVTDYLIRAVRPRLESLEGVQQAQILGGKTIAMRVWLNPNKMAALAVTPAEVRESLAANNFVAAVGDTKGSTLSIKLDASTSLHSVADFERLVVRRDGDTLIRLRDVAGVELGAESYETSVFFQGKTAVFIAIEVLPTANPLNVIGRVRDLFPDIQDQLPQGIEGIIVQDNTVYIRNSINEVVWSLGEALLIVTVVIYLFLGSMRSALVPAVAMPLSLIGALLIMLLMGFSLNLLTLLALILAIGTVVDDGIVVAENAHRHIEQGDNPFHAALRTGRELAGSIVAMNIVVLAVFAPIGFMTGLTGTLFTEFAFTIAGATLISGFLALTLSPMMCAKLLKQGQQKKGPAHWIDRGFERVANWYAAALGVALDLRWVVLVVGGVILISCYFLYTAAENELAPTEDQGFLVAQATGDPNISLPQMERWTDQLDDILDSFDATEYSFVINGAGGGGAARTNNAFAGMALKDWGQREQTQMMVMPQVQRQVAGIAGLDTVVFPPPSLPGAGGGLPVQLIIGSTEEPRAIFEIAQELRRRAMASGMFQFVDSDLKFDQLQMQIDIDRPKAAAIGLDMRQLGLDLATMLSQGYVNYFSLQGRSYRVIPQVDRDFQLTPEQLTQYYVRTASGQLVPMSTVVSLEETVQPRQLLRFNQLNSATISGVPAPGVALGEAVNFLRQTADETLPQGYVTDWAGQSRQYVQENTALVTAFFLAIILVYLVLAAQYESFRDPLIMLVSVPMSIAGALLFFVLGVVTVNIYTQVGLLALIGSIIRHGILLVEFGNQVQREDGLNRRDAIQKAAAIRFRAIIMTTIATLVGMIPLLIASGPGAESRFAIGFVLGAGLAVGTVFTLFVVPALYTVIAKERSPQDELDQEDQQVQKPTNRRHDMEPQQI
jgi:multidrug efflux pump